MLQDDPEEFEPVLSAFSHKNWEYMNGEGWAYGYMQGIRYAVSNSSHFLMISKGLRY